MSRLAFALCVLSLFAASCSAASQEDKWQAEQDAEPSYTQPGGQLQQHGHEDFGFFYFVRQWPGTFCSTHACPLVHHRRKYRFTVHGLWPNYNEGGWPQFCEKDMPFDEEELDDLLPQLEEVWPSYMDSRDSDSFWAHEWNKHGTCALSSLPNEHAYFKAILDLNSKYDLEVPLKEAGIVPSETEKYSAAEFTAAIKGAYGADFDIHCTSDGKLTEVWMCFDKELKPFNCPGHDGKSVSKQADLGYPRCDTIIMPPVPLSPEEEQQGKATSAVEQQQRSSGNHEQDGSSSSEEEEGTDERAAASSHSTTAATSSPAAAAAADTVFWMGPACHVFMLTAILAGVAVMARAAQLSRSARTPPIVSGAAGDAKCGSMAVAADEARTAGAAEEGTCFAPPHVQGLRQPLLRV